MKVLYKNSFKSDLKKIKDNRILEDVNEAIENVKKAKRLNDIKKKKKMQGWKVYYRIEIGEYRIGVKREGENIIFMRVLHRKDIYKYFP